MTAPGLSAPHLSTPPVRPGSGLPIASFLVSVPALVLSIPFGLLCFVFGTLAIVFGSISIRKRHRLWGMGLAGLIIAAVGIAITIVVPSLMFAILAMGWGAGDSPFLMYLAFCWSMWLGPFGEFGS